MRLPDRIAWRWFSLPGSYQALGSVEDADPVREWVVDLAAIDYSNPVISTAPPALEVTGYRWRAFAFAGLALILLWREPCLLR